MFGTSVMRVLIYKGFLNFIKTHLSVTLDIGLFIVYYIKRDLMKPVILRLKFRGYS